MDGGLLEKVVELDKIKERKSIDVGDDDDDE